MRSGINKKIEEKEEKEEKEDKKKKKEGKREERNPRRRGCGGRNTGQEKLP